MSVTQAIPNGVFQKSERIRTSQTGNGCDKLSREPVNETRDAFNLRAVCMKFAQADKNRQKRERQSHTGQK